MNTHMTDYRKAHRMALLSMDSYLEPEDFEKRYGGQFKFFSSGSTQCYVLQSSPNYTGNNLVPMGEIIICFRGTEVTQFADIKADLEFLKVYESGWGMVHEGFQESLNLVFDELMAYVSSNLTTQRLIFTGHSLGAGLATLCMARMGDVESELYTFGSPRVGDKGFSEAFRHQLPNCYRFRNHNDLVTRIPKIGYHHIGTMYYFDEVGELKVDPPWWYRFKEFCYGMLSGFISFEVDSLRDHSVSRYTHRLSKYNR
jgi:hypothetical protein